MSDRLTALAVEIEQHANASGWDQPPMLFALVDTHALIANEPEIAAQLGLDEATAPEGSLTPIEQEELPPGPLDEALATIGWSDEVAGCALVHEAVVLPPAAEEERPDTDDEQQLSAWAAARPDRRDVRIAVAVLRDGDAGSALRVRDEDEIMTGDLAPNVVAALLETLQ